MDNDGAGVYTKTYAGLNKQLQAYNILMGEQGSGDVSVLLCRIVIEQRHSVEAVRASKEAISFSIFGPPVLLIVYFVISRRFGEMQLEYPPNFR